MEQKKILWIVAALGIFLLVIFLGTLIIYSPQQTMPMNSIANMGTDTWVNTSQVGQTPPPQQIPMDQNQAQNSQEQSQTLPDTISQDGIVQSGDLTVISQGSTTVYAQEGITTIDLTQSQEAAPTTITAEPAVRPVATRVPGEAKAAVVESKAPTVSTTQSAPKAVVPAEQKKPTNQYWVQAASFVSKPNAEKARSELVKQKIPADVFTHLDGGITYYRVRVGPYTTKSEAEYWNSLIKTIDDFADTKSYVTNTSVPAQ